MKTLLWIYIHLFFPIFTLGFASKASLIDENLSYIGNMDNMHIYFIVWAILCELALAIGFHRCLYKSAHARLLKKVTLWSAGLFMVSILLPYLPQLFPILSELHIYLSFFGLILVLIDCAMLCMSLKMSMRIFPFDYILLLIYGIALGMYGAHHMSVNSLVEVFLSISLPIYLYQLGGYIA